MKKSFAFLLLVSILIFNSCKKESPSEPEENNNAGTTIGVQGGSIKVEDGQVTIASGTFSGDQKLNLTKTTVPVGHESDAISLAYKLENLPIGFSKPIELSVKLTGSISGDTILAVKVPSYVVSSDKSEDKIIYVRGKISNGTLTAKLDNLSASSFGKVSAIKEEGKFVIYFWSKANQISYISPKNRFRINYTIGTDKSAIINTGNILEECFQFVGDLGFVLSKRTGWPMDVNIVNRPGVFGEYISSKRSMNYDFMEIDKGSLSNERELKATLVHEFFHAAQTMYNPHWNLSSTILGLWKGGYEHLWLDEAVSTWSSATFLKDTKFVDQNFYQNQHLILSGISTIKTEAADYGYGMSIFIKYLVDKYTDKSLIKIYDKILKSTGSYYSVSSVTTLGLDSDWYNFVEKVLTDKVDLDKFSGRSYVIANSTKKQFTELKTTEETIALKLGALSSKVYSFDFPITLEATKNAQITFSTTAGEICVFRSDSKFNNLEKVGTSVGEYVLGPLKDVIEKKDKIVVAVSNATASPSDGTKDVTFKYKFEEAVDLSKILSATISVRFAANENNGSLVTPWESYSLPKFAPTDNWRGAWVGNKFIADFSRTKFASIYTNVTGAFTLTFDFAKKEITELTYDVSYNADGRAAKTKIVLQNLVLSNYNTQFGAAYAFYEFIKLGDIVCNNIKEISHTEINTVSGTTTTVTKTGCNSKSQIWIKLNEF